MDISGAQLNSAVLDAVAAQPTQSNRPAPAAPAKQQPSAEVTLSRDARERAVQTAPEPQPPAAAESKNPVQAPDEAPTAQEESNKNPAVQARENNTAEKQSDVAVQAQTTAATYTARVAAQSYTSVSNF